MKTLSREIVEFPSNERDEEFDFLVKKAINYRGLFERIKKKWKSETRNSKLPKKIQLADSNEDAQLIAYGVTRFLKNASRRRTNCI